MNNEKFLAERVIELEAENALLRTRNLTLRETVTTLLLDRALDAPLHEVSSEQFSLLAYEGTRQ